MNGYTSEIETDVPQIGGAKQRKVRTVKQRITAKARRDVRQMIKLSDTLPLEVRKSGFHYDEESNREVLEESRELGNQTDNELPVPNPVIKQQSIAYRVVSNNRQGGKPKVQIRGLALDYDNTQSPFINAAYLENGRIVEGILNAASKHGSQQTTHTSGQNKRQRKFRKKIAKKTAKKQMKIHK